MHDETKCKGECGKEFPVDEKEFFHICDECMKKLSEEIDKRIVSK